MNHRQASQTRPRIDRLVTDVYRIPTDAPESDATYAWDSTTIVVVHVWAADTWGVGYTYGPPATATLIHDKLMPCLQDQPADAIPAHWDAMQQALRNAGQPGIGAMAVAAVDIALWDLKAKLLDQPLATLLGMVRNRIPVYGSGGFTSYDDQRLARQLAGWIEQGISRVKMKVGRDAQADPHRVAVAREAIGDAPALFVDANGGYTRKQALAMAQCFAEQFNVTWFEEPRPQDDVAGLRLLRDRGPAGMDIAAGEYGYKLADFRHLIDAQAVDCLQADVSRCAGITGFMKVGALCEAHLLSLSAHCVPAVHAHLGCSLPAMRHVEYFHDHAAH